MRTFRALLLPMVAIAALLAACTPSEGGGGGTSNQAPNANAIGNPTTGQAPLLVEFSPAASFDPDGFIESYSWNFGDGSPVSTAPAPSHTYTTGGVFSATLTVTDDGGAVASAVVVVVVTPPGNLPPVSNISATTLAGKTPLTVDFDGAGSTDLDGTVVGYEWNFGDGAIATTPAASHLYDIPGNYVVTLKVTDNNGAVDTDSTIVSVADNLAPTAQAVATPTSGKAPLAVSFDAGGSSDGDGNVEAWSWDFTDGGTANTEVAVHTFTAVGTYDVELTVTDDNGATDTTTVTVQVNPPQAPVAVANAVPDGTKAPLGVVFSSLGSIDNDGSIIGYSWDFGDGSPASTSANPSHLYTAAGTFNAVLTVTDDDFLSTTATVPVVVGPPNVPPTAVGAATPAVGKPVLNVSFSSAGSTDSDGTVVGYSWNFGDGSPVSTAANPSHSYSVLGSYSVLLTVTDNDGAIKTIAVPVSVIPNSAPTAQPVATPRQGKEPLTVALTGGTSNDSDGTIVSYSWDYTTDGIADSTDVDTSFDYVTPGTYTASLTVTDEDGATDTGTVEITVNPNQPPTAVANADFQSGNAPFSVTFEGRDSLDAELEGVITYDWDFDDGSPHSTSATPTHVFQDIRDYNVTLTVTDDNGATGSDTIVIHALDPVIRVSTAGSDTTGDGTVTAPYATIQAGIDGAVTQVKTIVKVAGGTYSGFTAASGVSVIGGFDQDFVIDGPTGSNDVTVDAGAGAVAMTASGLALPITIKDLTLNGGGGADATAALVSGSTVTFDGVTATSGTASGAGSSAYGIRAIDDSTISVIDSSITAAGGVPGASGAPGTAGADGATGGNGTNGNAAGGAPINTATPAVRSGGAGGQGVKCVAILVCVSALPGNPGVAGGLNDPRGGDAGGGGVDNVGGGGGGKGGDAAPAAAPGAGGVAAPGDTFVAGTGGPGGVALAGPGGGGGGSGGSANNLLGAGNSGAGGAGGAGGAAGTGGAGGSGGGGSFAVYSSDSTVTIDGDTVLTTGAGGAGGTGGTGGKGGNGGAGGRGGGPSNSNPGAGGGAGGGGGGNGGGGGAGGNGGPSVGAYHSGTGTQTVQAPSVNELATIGTSGAAGTPGTGGAIGTAGAGGGAGGLAGGTGTVVTGAKIGGAGTAGPVGIVGPVGSAGSAGLRRYSFDNGVVTNAMPVAVTQASATSGIAAHTVIFGSSGSYDPDGTITYSWDFGDASPASTSAAPTHVYSDGTFVATLTVTDNDGAVATSTQTITVAVNELPAAFATATPEAGKAPLSVTFSSFGSVDTDGAVATYSWNFGDGSPVNSSANPTHVYTANGNYDAVLTVTDNKGGQATAHAAVTVSPNNVPPTVTILANPAVGKAPSLVSLYSESSDADGTVTSIVWDFGDGSPTTTNANPTHTYTTGVYTATFTATDNDGAVTTKSVLIRSLPNIAPSAVASASPSNGRAPLSTQLSSSGSVDFDGNIVSYSWSFGDGSPVSASANPTHVYAAGTWTATLTVTDDDGVIGTATTVIQSTVNVAPVGVANGTLNGTKAPLVVDFSSAGSTDNDGSIAIYRWDFGDGSPVSNAPNPSHTYATPGLRTATLTVTDNEGATDVKTVSVSVGPFNVAPVAAGTVTPDDGRAPLLVAFDSVGSTDSDGSVVGYSWDFGDGSPQESTSTASHTYAAGTWTATLTVTDDDGATTTQPFTIHSTVNVPPTAAASATPSTGLAPLSVAFSSAGTGDVDGTVTGYSWDFGDGSPLDTSANPSHVYAAGTFTATLTVTDNEGGVGTATVPIFANVAPSAVAVADVTSGDGPLTVQFTGSGSTDVDGSIVTHSWDFGDGSPVSAAADPTHTYAPGLYTATLTVTDNSGASTASTVVIDVNDKPSSSITSDITSGAAPLTVNFSGTADDPDGTFSFVWDFGDSTSNNSDLSPSHIYTDPGTYDVTLTVTDDRGSVAVSAVRTITVT